MTLKYRLEAYALPRERMLTARREAKKEDEDYKSRLVVDDAVDNGSGKKYLKTATFIKQLNKEIYDTENVSVADRLKKYSHYRQKGNIDEQSFL